jgi:hypothetical protein
MTSLWYYTLGCDSTGEAVFYSFSFCPPMLLDVHRYFFKKIRGKYGDNIMPLRIYMLVSNIVFRGMYIMGPDYWLYPLKIAINHSVFLTMLVFIRERWLFIVYFTNLYFYFVPLLYTLNLVSDAVELVEFFVDGMVSAVHRLPWFRRKEVDLDFDMWQLEDEQVVFGPHEEDPV